MNEPEMNQDPEMEVNPEAESTESSYENHVIPAEGQFDDREVGEEVTASITGKIIDKDGRKCVQIETLDGEPVVSEEAEAGEPEMDEEEAKKGAMESSKGLVSKLKEMNKDKTQMYE